MNRRSFIKSILISAVAIQFSPLDFLTPHDKIPPGCLTTETLQCAVDYLGELAPPGTILILDPRLFKIYTEIIDDRLWIGSKEN